MREPTLLRPWAESDAPGLRQAIDEDVDHLKPWLTWTLEEPATLERTRERLRGYVRQWEEGEAYRFAVTPLERSSTILGGVHLKGRARAPTREIGYWMRKSAAGRGVAGAAVARLTVHTFEAWEADRIVARCDVGNARSSALARALGFRRVGEVRDTYPDGTPRPLLEFEMTRDGFRGRHAAGLLRRARRAGLVTV